MAVFAPTVTLIAAFAELSLVVLIGPPAPASRRFAPKHFKPTEILSSDFCRGLVATTRTTRRHGDAFEVLHFIAAQAAAAGRLTVIDATNVQPEARRPLVALAREHHVLPVAIVLDLPERLCHERNQRAARPPVRPPRRAQPARSQLRRSLRGLDGRASARPRPALARRGRGVTSSAQPLWNNRRERHGPFDIIGDVHGCYDELVELLASLVMRRARRAPAASSTPPAARPSSSATSSTAGPKTPEVLRLVMGMVAAGHASASPATTT